MYTSVACFLSLTSHESFAHERRAFHFSFWKQHVLCQGRINPYLQMPPFRSQIMEVMEAGIPSGTELSIIFFFSLTIKCSVCFQATVSMSTSFLFIAVWCFGAWLFCSLFHFSLVHGHLSCSQSFVIINSGVDATLCPHASRFSRIET